MLCDLRFPRSGSSLLLGTPTAQGPEMRLIQDWCAGARTHEGSCGLTRSLSFGGVHPVLAALPPVTLSPGFGLAAGEWR